MIQKKLKLKPQKGIGLIGVVTYSILAVISLIFLSNIAAGYYTKYNTESIIINAVSSVEPGNTKEIKDYILKSFSVSDIDINSNDILITKSSNNVNVKTYSNKEIHINSIITLNMDLSTNQNFPY